MVQNYTCFLLYPCLRFFIHTKSETPLANPLAYRVIRLGSFATLPIIEYAVNAPTAIVIIIPNNASLCFYSYAFLYKIT